MRTERKAIAPQTHLCGVIGVLCPIMHEQSVRGVGVEPSSANQGGDQRAGLAIPTDPRLDSHVSVFADIALRCESARKMPDRFQTSQCDVFWAPQARHEIGELRVIWNSSQCHYAALRAAGRRSDSLIIRSMRPSLTRSLWSFSTRMALRAVTCFAP